MTGEPRAWVLNLDAEHELAAAGRFTPSAHLRALVRRERRRLLGNLVRPGDVVLDAAELEEERSPRRAAGLAGLAWSPTPNALRVLARAGARVPDAPPIAVLRAVNARPFAATVRAGLEHRAFAKPVATAAEAFEVALEDPVLGRRLTHTYRIETLPVEG